MNGLIHYKRNIYPSRKLPYKYLYTIKTRNTIYGIHKKINTSELTKTALLLFIEGLYATDFMNYLEMYQKENIDFDRACIELDGELLSNPIHGKSTYPLELCKESAKQLELLCLMNYFDMFIVSKTEKLNNELKVYCFEYAIRDLPSRNLIEFKLKYQD